MGEGARLRFMGVLDPLPGCTPMRANAAAADVEGSTVAATDGAATGIAAVGFGARGGWAAWAGLVALNACLTDLSWLLEVDNEW